VQPEHRVRKVFKEYPAFRERMERRDNKVIRVLLGLLEVKVLLVSLVFKVFLAPQVMMVRTVGRGHREMQV
jgi:hypothetical protein